MSGPRPQPGILDITVYVPGGSELASGMKPIKLSSNENALGPSPKAVEAYGRAAQSLARYPDGSATALRKAIGAHYGLDPGRIVCGAGSDELLTLLAQAYIGPGDEAIQTAHGFLVYDIATKSVGAKLVSVPEKNLKVDVDEILKRVTAKTRLVWLANPGNPTGTYLSYDEVKRLHRGLPPHVLLVHDAAYAEYVRRNDYGAGIELVATSENVVMTRTFSKIYGLAGLRIGWCYCPAAVADVLNRIRGAFNVTGGAIAAATAALADTAHVEKNLAHNDTWLARYAEALPPLGLEVTDSVTNFHLVRFPRTKGRTAADADAFLKSRGIIVRGVGGYGLPDCLRIGIGTDEENEKVIAALTDFMKGPRS
jgi:histidinol-phosphate aminotransferase